MPNLQEMSNAELKQYMAEHRNDDEAFSSALEVLMSRREPNAPRYSADMSLEEMEKVIKEKLDQAS